MADGGSRRSEPGVINAFKELWGTDQLLVSFVSWGFSRSAIELGGDREITGRLQHYLPVR
jgi:hypothetical protein